MCRSENPTHLPAQSLCPQTTTFPGPLTPRPWQPLLSSTSKFGFSRFYCDKDVKYLSFSDVFHST